MNGRTTRRTGLVLAVLAGLFLAVGGVVLIDKTLPEIGPCPGIHGETDTEACLRAAVRLGIGLVVVAWSLAAAAVTAWIVHKRSS